MDEIVGRQQSDMVLITDFVTRQSNALLTADLVTHKK